VTDAITWDLSPADVSIVAPLRYVPLLLVGGYAGITVTAGIVALPGVLSNPEVLALVALLTLVGGPLSLLYLWPMIRDPDQRPSLDQFGWLATLDPLPAVAAAVSGAILAVVGLATIGSTAVYGLLVLCVVLSLSILGLFDAEGSLDPTAGTLAFQERAVELDTLAGFRTWEFDSVTVCWLSYVDGAGGIGTPYLVTVPDSIAEEVLPALTAGVEADAGVEPRAVDRTARLALLGVAALSFGTGVSALLFLGGSGRLFVAVVTGGLGTLFVLGAYYAA